MDTEKKIRRVILLEASLSTVWDALINPLKTKQYMFNCEVQSDWTEGNPISWKGNYQGYESGEKGLVLVYNKEKELKYSSIDPNFGIEDIPINYLHITYVLKSAGYKTELIVIVENFNDDKNRLKHVAQGWDNIVIPALINTIKS